MIRKICKKNNFIQSPLCFFLLIVFAGLILFGFNIEKSLQKKTRIDLARHINQKYRAITDLIDNKQYKEAHQLAIDTYQRYHNEAAFIAALLGDLYFAKKDFKNAEYFYRAAVSGNKKEVRFYSQLCLFLRRGRFFESSLQVLEASKNYIPPDNPFILAEYGEYYMIRGDYERSLDYFSRSYYYNKEEETLIKLIKIEQYNSKEKKRRFSHLPFVINKNLFAFQYEKLYPQEVNVKKPLVLKKLKPFYYKVIEKEQKIFPSITNTKSYLMPQLSYIDESVIKHLLKGGNINRLKKAYHNE